MTSFAVSRANHAAAAEKHLLELGLHSATPGTPEEAPFYASIRDDASAALVFADWLEERGRGDEAALLRARKIAADDVETILDKGPRHGQRVAKFGPGLWSVVRRTTVGANGGHRQHLVSWDRIAIRVVRCTKTQAVLDDGQRMALNTLTGCVQIEA